MHNEFINGWLAEQERHDFASVFAASESSSVPFIITTDDAVARITEAAQKPIKTHPWEMARRLFEREAAPYEKLTTWNQDANNCAGHATGKAVDAFMLIQAWLGDRYEMELFENFIPWVWGVGKNEAGQPGTGGATMSAMLDMIAKNGVLPSDTPGLPSYQGTSDRWAKNYGKQAKNAPYSAFWESARKYRVTVANLPKNDDLFHLACKAGYAVAFGTSQRIVMNKTTRVWSASGSWMHAMAAYGYDPVSDSIGIDNSHGDGFAWANRAVLKFIVTQARYFDAFVILDITPRPGTADWNLIGRE